MNDTRTQLSNDDSSEKKQFAFVVVALFLLAGVMINISKTSKDKYAKKVFDNLKYKNSTILAKRGDITDRTGTILAYSEKVYNLILDPNSYWLDDTDRELNLNG